MVSGQRRNLDLTEESPGMLELVVLANPLYLSPLELADSTVCPLPASSGNPVRTSSTTQNFARIQ